MNGPDSVAYPADGPTLLRREPLRMGRALGMARTVAVSLLTLAMVASCAAPVPPGGGNVSSSTTPSAAAAASGTGLPTANSTSTGVPALGLVLGPVLDVAAPCRADRAYVTAGAVVWQGCDLNAAQRVGQIYEYSRKTELTRLLYQSAGGMTIVGASEEWVVWFEYSDIRTARDSTLYALQRSDGKRLTLDDWHDHPTLAQLADATLDGADVYWTVPRVENGAWHGALLRRRLPDGDTTVVVQAPVGAIIGYPSAHGGVVAFEYSVETGTPKTIVRYFSGTGAQRDLGPAAASEPALGDGFMVFKRAERYEVGDVGSYAFATGSVTVLGPGEQPRAEGPFVTWMSSAPTDGGIRVGRPLDNCVVKLPQGAQITDSWPALGPGYFAWAFRDDTRPAAEVSRFRVAEIRSVRC